MEAQNEFGYKYRQRPLDGKTRICGTLADPVHHTLSPQFQGACYEELGLNMVYVPFNVKAENIGDAVRGIRALNIRAVNVTMPHKRSCMEFLDEIDPLAKTIGAVTAIVNNDGILKGYNNDVLGFMMSLQHIDLKGKNVLLLGAGGAARTCAFGLAKGGAKMTIMNRTVDKATKLAHDLTAYSGNPARGVEMNFSQLDKEMKSAEIVVNTTDVGFASKVNETPIPKELIRPGMLINDIVFDPFETRLLREAKEQGAKTIEGLYMYIGQGAVFFELATGEKAPFDVMMNAGKKALEARNRSK